MSSNYPYEIVVEGDETWIEGSRYTVATDVSNEDAEFIFECCKGHIESSGLLESAMYALREYNTDSKVAKEIEHMLLERDHVFKEDLQAKADDLWREYCNTYPD